MGNTWCRRTMDSTLNSLATQNLQQLNSFLLEAIKNQWLLVLIIHDYTYVHTHRRPKGIHTSTAANMCTIVVKAFKNLKAIERPSSTSIISLHDEQGLDIDFCTQVNCSNNQLALMANTYVSTMLEWIVTQFFSQNQNDCASQYTNTVKIQLFAP